MTTPAMKEAPANHTRLSLKRTPATIPPSAITAQITDSDACSVVEATNDSNSQGTSCQWWMLRAASIVTATTPTTANAGTHDAASNGATT